MYPLLAASFSVIARKFPPRSFLKSTPLAAALGVYGLTLLISLVESAITPVDPEMGAPLKPIISLALDVASLVFILFIGMWVINRYVRNRFSLKEMFVLEMLLTSSTSIVFAVGSIIIMPLGDAGEISFGIGTAGIVFAIYMLLTFQKAISEIASITKSQAANVIIAPIAVLLLFWIVFLAFAGSFAFIE